MKIGEGFHAPTPDFSHDLKKSMSHFRAHLHEYEGAVQADEKMSILDRMEKEVLKMDDAAKNFKKETRVQEEKVHKDFETFKQNPSPHNADVLDQDLTTLEESLRH